MPSLAESLLTALSESAHPVPTPDLIAAIAADQTHPRQRVHVALAALLRQGLVERGYRVVMGDNQPHRWYRHKGRKVAVWSIPRAGAAT